MPLFAIGINHTTAPVEIRERVTFAPEHQLEANNQLSARLDCSENLILSTCNRTEIYCQHPMVEANRIHHWLADYHSLPASDLEPYIYTHHDGAAVQHLFRVASGLDSMIIGEPQILGQIKSAYRVSRQANSLGHILDRLLQMTFSVAKQVRTNTAIGSSSVSVASAAVGLARQIFSDLDSRTALLIGAGETIELVARHLREQGMNRMIIANRTLTRAQHLASEFSGYAITLDGIPAHLGETDIIVASTASSEPVLMADTVKASFKSRKHRPFFMVDLAVPRDIEARTADLEDVYLYTVDDLHSVIDENLRSRTEAAREAAEIVDLNVENFMAWLRSLDSVPTVCALRADAERDRDAVLEKARRLLRAGQQPEEVLQRLAHALTNKLLHRPCTRLRQAAAEEKNDLIDAARDLYRLQDKDRS